MTSASDDESSSSDEEYMVDSDDPSYDPDFEIDLKSMDVDDLKTLKKIRAERDSYYHDVPDYDDMFDRRRFYVSEISEWAGILDKYIIDTGNEKNLLVYVSDTAAIKRAYRVPRVILLFCIRKFRREKDFLHEIVVEFNNYGTPFIRIYDTSGYITTPADVWYIFRANLNTEWERYIKTNFDRRRTDITFAPIGDYNLAKWFGKGQCGAYSCWIAMYLVLNPTLTEYMAIPPKIPGGDAISFTRYMRVCINAGQLLLPASFKDDYVGFGKHKKNKRKENKDWKNFVWFLKHFHKR